MIALARLASLLTVCLLLSPAGAQNTGRWQPPRNVNLNDLRDITVDGTLEGVQSGIFQMKATAGHPYLIAMRPGYSKLGITGMAKPDYLKPGMFVSFSADLPKEKKGEVDEPLTDLAIISPSETNTPGLFNEDRDNKESTKYFVRGTVRSYKDGKLTVAAGGKQVIAPVPSDMDIKLESNDLALLRQGDTIKVAGKQYQQYSSQGNTIQPGQVIGQQIDITLQETLTAATFKKKPGK